MRKIIVGFTLLASISVFASKEFTNSNDVKCDPVESPTAGIAKCSATSPEEAYLAASAYLQKKDIDISTGYRKFCDLDHHNPGFHGNGYHFLFANYSSGCAINIHIECKDANVSEKTFSYECNEKLKN